MADSKSKSIAVLGTGLIGSAVVRALLVSGRRVNIWNRTPSRCAVLSAEGASACATSMAAVEASEVVFIAVKSYLASKALIADTALSGKIIVQLVTGTAEDAVDFHSFCLARNAKGYQEVKVMSYPDLLGGSKALLLASGPIDSFNTLSEVLEELGTVRFVGENASVATSAMLAWGVHYQVTLASVLEMITAAEALGVDPMMVGDIASFLGDDVRGVISRWLESANRAGPLRSARSGSVAEYLSAADLIQGSTDRVGIPLPLLDSAISVLREWVRCGLGEADIEDAFEAMRRRGTSLASAS